MLSYVILFDFQKYCVVIGSYICVNYYMNSSPGCLCIDSIKSFVKSYVKMYCTCCADLINQNSFNISIENT